MRRSVLSVVVVALAAALLSPGSLAGAGVPGSPDMLNGGRDANEAERRAGGQRRCDGRVFRLTGLFAGCI